MTDVVFSVLGHPLDKKGRKIQNELLINIDIYFVYNDKLCILDMGIVTLKLSEPFNE